MCATALAASVTDPHQFRSGRQFAAWLGLTPLQHSSGGKERLGRISKMGDKYLRRLLVVGMTSLIRRAKYKPEAVDPWLAETCSRKPARLVTVALANKAARVVWAIMVRGGVYRRPAGVDDTRLTAPAGQNTNPEVARTMRCDGEPVRLGMRTTRRMSRASQPDKQNGTLSVHTIKASGHVHRSNRPNTRLHPTTTPEHQITLAMQEPSTHET